MFTAVHAAVEIVKNPIYLTDLPVYYNAKRKKPKRLRRKLRPYTYAHPSRSLILIPLFSLDKLLSILKLKQYLTHTHTYIVYTL